MTRSFRRPRIVVAGTLLLMTVGVAPRAATAANAPPARPSAPTTAKQITLITGDRVSVGAGADGKPMVRQVTPAARPDHTPVAFQTLTHGGELYVVPSDATPLIADHRLDLGLFDVGYLAANGYDDRAARKIPVILRYPAATPRSALSARARALPDTTPTRTLESVHATAADMDKARIAQFWNNRSAVLRSGVTGIQLDHRVHAVLDQSVPQIGAPAAWAAGLDGKGVTVGILDTGIDDTHPDLAGKVVDRQNFTSDPDAVDHNGHGTHVASTIAGTGAASNGRYKGVAPGAKLLIGKVLNNTGAGSESDIIDGMEWAVAHHARIVSMSLGGIPTDGTDDVSRSLDNLSAQSGTLFVVAAGNGGPSPQTINAPGAADAALTVAAVDKSDKLAGFSGRGPRTGDRGLKPDIAAPGVGIVAARAAGTTLGPVVDDHYTKLSGTSMATPHVAGAAAILAEQHPDWTGTQLKAALTSTAKDDGYTAYEQGAGRVDVARAFHQGVYAGGGLDFGAFAYPQSGSLTKTLTYTNTTDRPVTLTPAAALRAYDGTRAPNGMLTLGQQTVTVPAHGSAGVAVTIDPGKAVGGGAYQGTVQARDASGAIHLTTTVGVFNSPATAKLSVATKLPAGTTRAAIGRAFVVRMDGRGDLDDGAVLVPQGGTVTLAKGTYTVAESATWKDAGGTWNGALPVASQVKVDSDASVAFDLNKAKKIAVDTPKASETYNAWISIQRVDVSKNWVVGGEMHPPYGAQNFWTLPVAKPTLGTFKFTIQYLLGAPLVRMSVRGMPALHPAYQGTDPAYPKLDGRRSLPLVDAGHGTPEDFAGLDARGKLVLLSLDDICPNDCTADALDRVTNAKNAGAVGVLGYSATGRSFLNPEFGWPAYPIPTLSLPADEGRSLAGARDVTVQVDAAAQSPYTYALKFYDDHIPGQLTHRVGPGDLYRVDDRIHADRPAQARQIWDAYRPGEVVSDPDQIDYVSAAPRTQTEYVGPVDPALVWRRQIYYDYGPNQEAMDIFDRKGRRTETWGEQPMVPAATRLSDAARTRALTIPDFGAEASFCGPCRTVDTFTPMFNLADGDAHHTGVFTWFLSPEMNGGNARYEQRLDRDGQPVPLTMGTFFLGCSLFCIQFPIPSFVLPGQRANYRLAVDYSGVYPDARYGQAVDTDWTFTSSRADGATADGFRCWGQLFLGNDPDSPCRPGRLLYLRYGIDLGLDNALPAGTTHTIKITGYHTPYLGNDPALTSVAMSVTFDNGAHWQAVRTSAGKGNIYTATFAVPPLGQTGGAVGIRTQATDAEGNTINQTVYRAYGLRN